MSAGELCSADFNCEAARAGSWGLEFAVAAGCFRLNVLQKFLLLSVAQECLELESKEVAPGGFAFIALISAPACKSVLKGLTK